MDVQQTLNHLGGLRALRLMVGAYAFVEDSEAGSLSFRFKGSTVANGARVVLDASDTYTLTLYKVRGTQVRKVAVEEGLYAEDLRGRFEALTGLVLTVPHFAHKEAP